MGHRRAAGPRRSERVRSDMGLLRCRCVRRGRGTRYRGGGHNGSRHPRGPVRTGAFGTSVSPVSPAGRATIGTMAVWCARHVRRVRDPRQDRRRRIPRVGALAGDEGYVAELSDVAGRASTAVVLAAVDAEDGRPIGCATYVPGLASPLAEELGPGEASIRMLAVDPAATGVGGQRARAACVAMARRDGFTGSSCIPPPWPVRSASTSASGSARARSGTGVPVPEIHCSASCSISLPGEVRAAP